MAVVFYLRPVAILAELSWDHYASIFAYSLLRSNLRNWSDGLTAVFGFIDSLSALSVDQCKDSHVQDDLAHHIDSKSFASCSLLC